MQTKSQEKIVFDAWALLALIFGEEPAAKSVKDILGQKSISRSTVNISWINIGEVYYIIARKKGPDMADEVLNDIKMLISPSNCKFGSKFWIRPDENGAFLVNTHSKCSPGTRMEP